MHLIKMKYHIFVLFYFVSKFWLRLIAYIHIFKYEFNNLNVKLKKCNLPLNLETQTQVIQN